MKLRIRHHAMQIMPRIVWKLRHICLRSNGLRGVFSESDFKAELESVFFSCRCPCHLVYNDFSFAENRKPINTIVWYQCHDIVPRNTFILKEEVYNYKISSHTPISTILCFVEVGIYLTKSMKYRAHVPLKVKHMVTINYTQDYVYK